jgi:hypothetical protein
VTAAAALGAATVFLSGTAHADPGGPPPCGPLGIVCNLLPMAPELDEDVDLTQRYQPAPEELIDAENLPPVDVCAMGCV